MDMVLAQVLGLITGTMSIIAICLKKRSTFLYGRCVKGTINCIQNYFLKEINAIPLVITEIVQSYTYTKTKKRWVAIPFICIIYGLCFWLYDGIKLYLLLIGYAFSSVAFLHEDIRKIKLYQAGIYIMWLPWDITIGNYSKVLCHIVAIIIVVCQFIKERKEKKGNTE